MSQEPLPLGVLSNVSNGERKYALESKTLHVGHLKVNGKVRAVAFTTNELSRPLARADKNLEDLPTLETSDELKIQALETENKKLKKELEALQNRGFFSRLFNRFK